MGASSSGRPRCLPQDRRPGDALPHPPSRAARRRRGRRPLRRGGHRPAARPRRPRRRARRPRHLPGRHAVDPRDRPERRRAAPALGPARPGARIGRPRPPRHLLPRRRRRRDPPARGAPRGRRSGGAPAHRAGRAPRRRGPRRGRRRQDGRHGRGRHPDGRGPGLGGGGPRRHRPPRARRAPGRRGRRAALADRPGGGRAHAPRRGAPRIDPLHLRGGRLAAPRVPPRRPGVRRGVPDPRWRGVRVGLRARGGGARRRGARPRTSTGRSTSCCGRCRRWPLASPAGGARPWRGAPSPCPTSCGPERDRAGRWWETPRTTAIRSRGTA